MINILGFAGHAVSGTAIRFCHCSVKTATNSMKINAVLQSILLIGPDVWLLHNFHMSQNPLLFIFFFNYYKCKSILSSGAICKQVVGRSRPAGQLVWPLLMEDAETWDNHLGFLRTDLIKLFLIYLSLFLRSEFDWFANVIKIVIPLLILNQNSDSC